MRIIGIDTSSSVATVAILNDNKLESEIYLDFKMQHSVVLFPMIEELLRMLNIKMENVDGVAVSGGPGSFTGLRIGVSTAKGIAQGGDMRFIGVSSLEAMAFQQVGFEGIICPIMDALRENVYTKLFAWKDGELDSLSDYEALHIDELIQLLTNRGEKVIFCGDGVDLYREKLQRELGVKAEFSPLSMKMPRASSIAELGLKKLSLGLEDDIYTYSPIYIRKSQAEREYERKNGVLND